MELLILPWGKDLMSIGEMTMRPSEATTLRSVFKTSIQRHPLFNSSVEGGSNRHMAAWRTFRHQLCGHSNGASSLIQGKDANFNNRLNRVGAGAAAGSTSSARL